jgi:hypothetical protein
MDWEDWHHMIALEREVEYLKTLLQPHDTGHIFTAISVLQEHIDNLKIHFANEFRDAGNQTPGDH